MSQAVFHPSSKTITPVALAKNPPALTDLAKHTEAAGLKHRIFAPMPETQQQTAGPLALTNQFQSLPG